MTEKERAASWYLECLARKYPEDVVRSALAWLVETGIRELT
jgi:hypothetical protein